MKQQILFITTNAGKVATCQGKVNSEKFEIVQHAMDLPEIQSSQVREIAIAKAQHAYQEIQKPLIVQDSGFCIPALNNFPGPYVKFVWDMIGSAGVLKLMDGVEDRRAFFDMCLVYIDESGYQVFENVQEGGRLTTEIYPVLSSRSWGDLWEIYIPYGFDKPLASFTDEELLAREKNNRESSEKKNKGEFAQFAQWLEGREE